MNFKATAFRRGRLKRKTSRDYHHACVDLVFRHPMIAVQGLAMLLLLQALGEAISHALTIPVPGPVLGMAMLLPALRWSLVRRPVQAAAELLLAHLSLLFVPVGVGVVTHLDLVANYGLRLLLVIALSTWIGMTVAALVLKALLPAQKEKG